MPIQQQFLASFAPVLIVLGLLSFVSYRNYELFFQNFDQLAEVTEKNLIFRDIHKDVIQLQRNTLVFSYVGYTGVLKKVELLQKQLEGRFRLVGDIIDKDPVLKERFDRMFGHYQDYKSGFSESVMERSDLGALKKTKFEPLVEEAQSVIEQIILTLEKRGHFDAAYLASQIHSDLLQANLKSRAFFVAPDGSLIKLTSALLVKMEAQTVELQSKLDNKATIAKLSRYQELLERYKETFLNMVSLNSAYLHLVNVVLAGKAAEMEALATELGEAEKERSLVLAEGIKTNVRRSQSSYLLLSAIAASLGLIGALLIAVSITKPVVAMSNTLSLLANGESSTEIPGQDRQDEVGDMARAANEFKLVAEQLEEQTNELEEFAYRTSHDLRSPLVSSIGVLKLVDSSIQDNDSAGARHGLDLVQSSLAKLEVLVRDIHALAETKHVEEELQDFELGEIVQDALLKLGHMENFNRLDVRLDLRLHETLCAQRSRVVLIVENMISNAIKYQDLAKDGSFLRISSDREFGKIVFEVEDNGLGVPEKYQASLFTMFRRFHPQVAFGSGLGLYMMKKSAEVLKGSVAYRDTGSGSIFRLTL